MRQAHGASQNKHTSWWDVTSAIYRDKEPGFLGAPESITLSVGHSYRNNAEETQSQLDYFNRIGKARLKTPRGSYPGYIQITELKSEALMPNPMSADDRQSAVATIDAILGTLNLIYDKYSRPYTLAHDPEALEAYKRHFNSSTEPQKILYLDRIIQSQGLTAPPDVVTLSDRAVLKAWVRAGSSKNAVVFNHFGGINTLKYEIDQLKAIKDFIDPQEKSRSIYTQRIKSPEVKPHSMIFMSIDRLISALAYFIDTSTIPDNISIQQLDQAKALWTKNRQNLEQAEYHYKYDMAVRQITSERSPA